MGLLSPILRNTTEGVAFWCPGCRESHHIKIGGSGGWSWNGDVERPVFSPSVLVTSGHYMSAHKPSEDCWCTANAKRVAAGEDPHAFGCTRCHSFVGCNGAEPGQIIFLSDSTHALAGQTVPMVPFPSPNWSDG